MEENKQVQVFNDEGTNMIMSLTGARTECYSSLVATTPEEKKAFFNLTNNPEKRLQDCINMTINMCHVYVEIVQCEQEGTGQMVDCPRIVIIDDKNNAYQCVSKGIFMCLKKIFGIFGEPTTWNGKPLKVIVKQVTTRSNRKTLTLEIA